MVKKLSALKARQNLGQIMNEVALRGDDYIIERAGRPLVAVISMEKYQALQRDREDLGTSISGLWAKMKGEDPAVVERTLDEAIRAIRTK
jgi:prevent-host-death family protein